MAVSEGTAMSERVEWEVVDERAPGNAGQGGYTGKRPTLQQLLKTVLGRWWRWKIAGAATVAALAVILFATVAGVIVLSLLAIGIVSIGIAKIRRWLRRDGGPLVRRGPGG
jgi:hypothetical protein